MSRTILLTALLLLPAPTASSAETETRQVADIPEPMREHMLANMRDHLLAVGQITALLAERRYEAAADLAEERLGMSAMQHHGAHRMANHMPEAMRAIGDAMHRSASRFALAAHDAEVTGDPSTPLTALSDVIAKCVACHDRYRLR